MLTSCAPALAAADIDLTAIRLPERALPYPGRVEPLDPMPTDRDTDPMDVVDPGARPTGMVSPNSNDNGCQSMGREQRAAVVRRHDGRAWQSSQPAALGEVGYLIRFMSASDLLHHP